MKRRPPKRENIDPVTQYAIDVTFGKEVAGPLVTLACQRHLKDLEFGPKRGLVWDISAAERVFEYFSTVLKLTDEAGGDDKPFILRPPQMFIVGSLFGWKIADGSRRFRCAYIEIGKGSGKSPLAGGIALYMLTADGEQKGQVYAAAVDKDQAKVPFLFAVGMVNSSPLLNAAITKSGGKYGDETRVHNLFHRKSGSFFRPLSSESSGKGKSGFLVHCAILDEIHEHSSSAMVEFVRKNTKGRRQPLILMITNSGEFNSPSPAYGYHEYGEKVLNGIREDDEFFFYICGLDGPRKDDDPRGPYKGDDYRDPAVWPKANPMLKYGVPPMRYLEAQVREAAGMPAKESLTRRLNFCEWVGAVDQWITKALWDANEGSVNAESLRGRKCYGGLDLSKRDDLTAFLLVFPDDDGTFDVLLFAWTPQVGIEAREERDGADYQRWVEEGWLLTTPGKTIDYDFVAAKIGELTQKYDIEAVAFDHWHFDEMEKALNAADVNLSCIDHQQGFVGMNPAIEATEEELNNSRLRHGGNPLLTWAIFNVKVDESAQKLRMFDKQKATGRIDPAVALVMAVSLAVANDGNQPGSYASTVI